MGHSMGCQAVAETIVRHPGLCAGYVLLGPTVDLDARSRPRQVTAACAPFLDAVLR